MGIKKILVLTLLVLLSGCSPQQTTDKLTDAVCTMEAKLCPDGSYVGRTGPNCEFAKCPDIETPSDWLEHTDDKMSFQYPADFNSDYISATYWPPNIETGQGEFSCSGETVNIDDREYCLIMTIEGAAGSQYVSYNYIREQGEPNDNIKIAFTLQFPQCANYPDDQKAICETEQAELDINRIVDQISQSVRII